MKILLPKILLTGVAFLFCIAGKAQINLVKNGGFEDYSVCPTNNGEVEKSIGWFSTANSPDYFNTCAPSLSGNGVSPPSTNFGFQYPLQGNAYMGAGMLCPDNHRETIRGTLVYPLTVGVRYYVSFKVSLAERTTKYASNKIGALFTNQQYESMLNPAPLPANFAHIYTNTIITDTFNWTKVSGSFIADSAYQYIMIGNFFDDTQTTFITVLDSLLGECSYYFIDDVCVSSDSAVCNQLVESTFAMPTAFSPNNDNVNDVYQPVPSNISTEIFRIYNQWGQLIHEASGKNVGWDGTFKGEPQPIGVYAYYIEVKSGVTGKIENRTGSFALMR